MDKAILELLSRLFPKTTHLQLDAWHMHDAATQVTLHMTSTQPLGHCPTCAFPTRRIYRHYTRVLTDLPWGGVSVRVQVRVRKFFCANGRCTRQIFTERMPRVVSLGPAGPDG